MRPARSRSDAVLRVISLAVLLSGTPLLASSSSFPFAPMTLSMAWAKDNGGDSGNSGRGGEDGGDSNQGGGHGGSSGHGGDAAGGDHRGGRGGRDDSAPGRRSGPNGGAVEIDGDSIEITYPGGWKEEIRNGTFELKDPEGRTVVERRATADDLRRMRSLAP